MPPTAFRSLVRLCTSVVLVCFTLMAVGQKNFVDGYIIEKNRDSIRGQIDYRDWGTNPGHIIFRQTDGARSRILGTADLLAFGVNGDRYEAYTIRLFPYSSDPERLASEEDIGAPHDTTVFLQVVTRGRLTLWEFRETTGTNYYFITGREKPEQLRLISRIYSNNGTIRFDQQEAYKNQLSFLLQDCGTAARRVKATEYKRESLGKLIFSYNNCGKDMVKKRGDDHDRGKVLVFPVAGFEASTVKFSGSGVTASQHYPASSSPVIGAGALFILARNRQQFSFVTDLTWQHFHSESDSVSQNIYITQAGHIDYSLLKLDILFRYRYPAGRVRPFVEAGISNSTAIGMKAYQSFSDRLDNSRYTGPFLGGGTRTYQPGWLLGAGWSMGHWTVEGRFEATSGISDVISTSSPTRNWYALISYSL